MDSTDPAAYPSAMLKSLVEPHAIGMGVYDGVEALRLINFVRGNAPELSLKPLSRQTLGRWLRGYDHEVGNQTHHSEALWVCDYADPSNLELSFRDLIEVRFVKAFRDAGLSLQTIRTCLGRAAEEVRDSRPFSTARFKTDGKTIFLDITDGVDEGALVDLRGRQTVFRTIIEPSLHDLEFDAGLLARWYPLGRKRSVVVDPTRSFGRPISLTGIPTQTILDAVQAEGSERKVAALYVLPMAEVRAAVDFQRRLAA